MEKNSGTRLLFRSHRRREQGRSGRWHGKSRRAAGAVGHAGVGAAKYRAIGRGLMAGILPTVDRFSALFENSVRLPVYLALFGLRHPASLGGLTCAGLGVAGVRLVLHGIGALFRFREVLGGKLSIPA